MPLKYIKGKKESGLSLVSISYYMLVKNREISKLLNVDSELYCKIHKLKLIHNKIIIYGKNNTFLEIGYCSQCHKEYCEYTDVSPVYISNYEWLYSNYNDKV